VKPDTIAGALASLVQSDTIAPVEPRKGGRPRKGASPSKNHTVRLPDEVKELWDRARAVMERRNHGVPVNFAEFVIAAGNALADEVLAEEAKEERCAE
jgi:hypothetical protein